MTTAHELALLSITLASDRKIRCIFLGFELKDILLSSEDVRLHGTGSTQRRNNSFASISRVIARNLRELFFRRDKLFLRKSVDPLSVTNKIRPEN